MDHVTENEFSNSLFMILWEVILAESFILNHLLFADDSSFRTWP
jgi:hypothetical protein